MGRPERIRRGRPRHAARHCRDRDFARASADREGKVVQATEGAVGPYELHDFFLFHFLRYGAPPEKILFLARQAEFARSPAYSDAELRKWLGVFLRRFFANQFKRSALPDGPKVGSISLSPRGDWRMPSDAAAALWLAE